MTMTKLISWIKRMYRNPKYRVILFVLLTVLTVGMIYVIQDSILHSFTEAGSVNLESYLINNNVKHSTKYAVSPNSGEGLYFDGTKAINISSLVQSTLSADQGTVMMWIKPDDIDKRQYPFFGVGKSDINRFYIQIENAQTYSNGVSKGDRYRLFRGAKPTVANIDLVENPDLNEWYHIAMVWKPVVVLEDVNGVPTEVEYKQLKGYINGKLVDIENFTGNGLVGNFYIGGIGGKSIKETYEGYMDEPEIHSNAYTQLQIQEHIENIIPTPVVPDPEPDPEPVTPTESFPDFLTDKELESSGIECSEDYGIVGKGCYFDNQGINISEEFKSSITAKNGTVMMWLNPQSIDSRQYVLFGVAKDSGDYNRFYIQIEKAQTYSNGVSMGDRIRLFRGIKPTASIDLIENPDLNEWYHVAMTWSTDDDGKTYLKGYLNGEQIGSPKEFVSTTVDGNYYFGGKTSTSEVYDGYIDEPQFLNTEVSAIEIANYYNEIANPTPDPVEEKEMFNIVRNDLTNIVGVEQVGNIYTPRHPHKENHPLTYTYVRNTFDQMLGVELDEDYYSSDTYVPDYSTAIDNGINAMFLNMATGWIPYWRTSSKCTNGNTPYQSLFDHEEWWRLASNNDPDTTTKDPNNNKTPIKPYSTVISQFILEGTTGSEADPYSCNNPNDFIDIMMSETKATNKLGVISFSLNDHQGFARLAPWNTEDPSSITDAYNVTVNKFAKDNIEKYSLVDVTNETIKDQRERDLAQDWTHEEVRKFKIDLIKSVLYNYDIDGIDLNFSRFPYLFPDLYGDRTDLQRDLVRDFVIEVDKIIKAREAQIGKDLLLTITATSEDSANIGTPLFLEDYNPENSTVDIDYIIVQESFYTDVPDDIPVIREKVSEDIGLLYTFSYTFAEIAEPVGLTINSSVEGKLNRSMINALAYLTYNQGVDGYAGFNLPYYEKYGQDNKDIETYGVDDIRGPWNIPPYDIFKTLKNTTQIADIEDFTYFVGIHHHPLGTDRKTPQFCIDKNTILKTGVTKDFYFNTYSPRTKWKNGVLEVMFDHSMENKDIEITFNGQKLQEITDYEPTNDSYNPVPVLLDEVLADRDTYSAYPIKLDNNTCVWFRDCYKYYKVPSSLMLRGFYKNNTILKVNSSNEDFSIMTAKLIFQ